MKPPINTRWGRFALLAAHCAGLIDLAALPLWMEVLITDYRLGPQRAGALVSIFLAAGVASSTVFAPRFGRVSGARATFIGYGVAALAFAVSTLTTDFASLCACYVVGGAAVGCGLSFTHGTIGRSANPHRLFAWAGAAFGVFAIAFFGVAPQLIARFGGGALFWLFAGVMAAAAVLCALAFPAAAAASAAGATTPAAALPDGTRVVAGQRQPLQAIVWFAIVGVVCMALTQALIASFVQRIGLERGFGAERVNAVLLGLAALTLLPAPLAAVLQRSMSARTVVVAGPLVQMAVALAITQHTPFWAYAVGGCMLTSVQIFVHTFAFGLIARIDVTGRAAAATPAMLMSGSALGPFLAGTLVGGFGTQSLGAAAVLIGVVAVPCFRRAGGETPLGQSSGWRAGSTLP